MERETQRVCYDKTLRHLTGTMTCFQLNSEYTLQEFSVSSSQLTASVMPCHQGLSLLFEQFGL